MRILIAHNYYKIPGGEDTVVANEKKLLEANGHEVYIYQRSNCEMDFYSVIQKLLLPVNTVFSYKSYKDVIKILDEKKIDILHVHNTVCVISPSIYYAAQKRKVPVVQTIHNYRLLCPSATFLRNGIICDECVQKGLFHACKYSCYRGSKLQTFALAFTEALHKTIGTYKRINYICLTEFNKQQLLRINTKKKYIEPNKVHIKPNFVINRREIIPYSKRKNQIIYLGRIEESKGIKVLFEAWKNISQYELVVCGIGPLDDWCHSFITENDINNIRMLGFVPNETAVEMIAESKATILPTQCYEGFPMVLVESFSCGTPVIGSKIGNVGSIIQEGINGVRIVQTDVQSIIDAVNGLQDLCTSTYEIGKELYSPETNYKKLITIYKEALRGGLK